MSKWTLMVDGRDHHEPLECEFDEKPSINYFRGDTSVLCYGGEQDGRPMEVYIVIPNTSVWWLLEKEEE